MTRGPLVLAAQRRAGDDVGVIGAAVVADEEAFVVVWPSRRVDGRVSLHALVHREVPDVVLVDLERAFRLERHRVKLARGGEGRVDQRLRHPVAGQVEEADRLAGASHLARRALERPRLRAKRRSDVDQGDRLRRLVKLPSQFGLICKVIRDKVSTVAFQSVEEIAGVLG